MVKRLISRSPAESLNGYVDNLCPVFGTPLYAAAYRGDVAIMEALLDAGANVDLEAGNNGAPLAVACSMNPIDAIKLLLRRGAKDVVSGIANGSLGSVEQHSLTESVQKVLSEFRESASNTVEATISAAPEMVEASATHLATPKKSLPIELNLFTNAS